MRANPSRAEKWQASAETGPYFDGTMRRPVALLSLGGSLVLKRPHRLGIDGRGDREALTTNNIFRVSLIAVRRRTRYPHFRCRNGGSHTVASLAPSGAGPVGGRERTAKLGRAQCRLRTILTPHPSRALQADTPVILEHMECRSGLWRAASTADQLLKGPKPWYPTGLMRAYPLHGRIGNVHNMTPTTCKR